MNNNDHNIVPSDDQTNALMVLFLLYVTKMDANDKLWPEFEHGLVYENRFHSSHKIVQEVREMADKVQYTLKSGAILYRARIFDQSQFDQFITYYLETTGVSKEDIGARIRSMSELDKSCTALMGSPIDISENFEMLDAVQIRKIYEKWKNRHYKGFDFKNSTAPPAQQIRAGRANPDHIRYLYLSEDATTPVYEVRPIIGQLVSVARFRVKRDLSIFDLSIQDIDPYQNAASGSPSLFYSIGQAFSKPYNGNSDEYIPTQYITEEIKRMGFDGIRFDSSLNAGGTNIVLFSDEFCKPFASDLVEVGHITLDIHEPIIYHLFDHEAES